MSKSDGFEVPCAKDMGKHLRDCSEGADQLSVGTCGREGDRETP